MLLLFPFAGFAHAAETAGAEIPVVIEGGGTATMISEVNTPLPVESTIQVDNGRTGRFHIDFTAPGVYHYTIKAEFAENGSTREADTTYRVTVEVYERKDGVLYTVTTINSNINPDKMDLVRFDKTPPTTTTQPSTTQPDTTQPGTTQPGTTQPGTTQPGTTQPGTTQPGTTQPGTTQPGTTQPGTTQPGTTKPNTTQPGTTKPPKTTRPPRTGDETHLLRYVLVAMASSLGLFLLAMLYTVNTNKLIHEDEYFD